MYQIRKAERKKARIMALQGGAGSGKTYSSLLIAYGLCQDWSKIVIIDTEDSSADLYSDLGAYNVLGMSCC
jgi:archaellum biogenesis ATPase FlaH